MFKESKTAQMSAYFLQNADHKRMPHLKLMKLLYLADRESISRYDVAMTGDNYFSLPHGPILSRTKDLMDGYSRKDSTWPQLIADKRNYEVAIAQPNQDYSFDELSPADTELLDFIWDKFGAMDQWEITDYTHEHCHEWTDPDGSHIPISIREIASALGKTKSDIKVLDENLAIEQNLARL